MLEIRDISDTQRLGLLNLARFAVENKIRLKREIERSGTQLLLNRLLNNQPYQLQYTEHKKPFLAGRNEKISISHSHDILVILLDERSETGVDVELIREKVLKIRHRFLSSQEMDFAGEDICRLITIWAAKEAMYKAYGRKSLDFRRDLQVKDLGNDLLSGTLRTPAELMRFNMKREMLGDYILVYIIGEG